MEKRDLLDAVARRDHESARRALAAGVPADASDHYGTTGLLRAAGLGDGGMVALLLENGADVDKSSDQGNTPLMLAAARGHADIVRDLLHAGADPARRNKWDFSADDWAKWSSKAADIQALLAEWRRES